MPFPYKHVLLVGATSGIGLAMANKLIKEGVKVTAVGRRKERLEQFVKYNGSNASMAQFDMTDADATPQFAADMFKQHPDLDCIFLNAGTQRPYAFDKPETVDIKGFLSEMHMNFDSMVVMTHAFLPLLMKQSHKTGIIYTSTHLAHIPAFHLAAYSASKAALNSFILSVRFQLQQAKSNVSLIELLPPVVQTELHDYMGEERGRAMGMPVDAFTEQAYNGLASGKDEVSVGGMGIPGTPEATKVTALMEEVASKRQEAFTVLSEFMHKAMERYKAE